MEDFKCPKFILIFLCDVSLNVVTGIPGVFQMPPCLSGKTVLLNIHLVGFALF